MHEPRSRRAHEAVGDGAQRFAIASIAAGFITPLAALAFGVPGAGGRGPAFTALSAVTLLATGIGLHMLARRLLGRARRMTGSELFLLFLGPVLALVAGPTIYAIGARGTSLHRTVRAGAGSKDRADRR